MLTVSGKKVRGTIDVPHKPSPEAPPVSPVVAVPMVAKPETPVVTKPETALDVKANLAKQGAALDPSGISPITAKAVLAGEVIPPKPKEPLEGKKSPTVQQEQVKSPSNTAKKSRVLGYAVAGASILGAMVLAAFGARAMKGGERVTGNPSSPATNEGGGFTTPYSEFVGSSNGTIPGAIY